MILMIAATMMSTWMAIMIRIGTTGMMIMRTAWMMQLKMTWMMEMKGTDKEIRVFARGGGYSLL